MKLHELKPLYEEPIQIRSAEELWTENGAEAGSYITKTIYYIRAVKDKKDEFEVLYDDAGKRIRYGVMNQEDLDAAFVPIRSNQKPDAEGFLMYRSGDVYDAFKYEGDLVKVALSDDPAEQPVKLNRGDFLLRQDDGDNFTYTVETSDFFGNKYVKKSL